MKRATMTRGQLLAEANRFDRLVRRERRAGRATADLEEMADRLRAEAHTRPWPASALVALASDLQRSVVDAWLSEMLARGAS